MKTFEILIFILNNKKINKFLKRNPLLTVIILGVFLIFFYYNLNNKSEKMQLKIDDYSKIIIDLKEKLLLEKKLSIENKMFEDAVENLMASLLYECGDETYMSLIKVERDVVFKYKMYFYQVLGNEKNIVIPVKYLNKNGLYSSKEGFYLDIKTTAYFESLQNFQLNTLIKEYAEKNNLDIINIIFSKFEKKDINQIKLMIVKDTNLNLIWVLTFSSVNLLKIEKKLPNLNFKIGNIAQKLYENSEKYDKLYSNI